MDNLEKTIIVLGSILVIVIAIGFVIQTINKSSVNSNSIIMKAQHKFTSSETNAIENSHLPITINPANTLVFGSWKNTSVRICGQQQSLFGYNSTLMDVKYQGFYVPTIAELEAEYVPNSNYTNLIGQKVYLDFILNNNNNASAPYIINKIYAKGNEVYWIFNQDTGVSNENAVSIKENITIQMLSPKMVNGVIFLNGTPLISPMNPYINFTSPNC
jgi:hypothetical protein